MPAANTESSPARSFGRSGSPTAASPRGSGAGRSTAGTPERTILDLAATLDRRGIERLLDQAEVDFLFADRRLVAETDGWRHHRSRRSFETDRARDAALASAGYRTLRFTHRQVTHDPGAVMRAVRAAYRGASAASSVA